jgi:hypothetical protein
MKINENVKELSVKTESFDKIAEVCYAIFVKPSRDVYSYVINLSYVYSSGGNANSSPFDASMALRQGEAIRYLSR